MTVIVGKTYHVRRELRALGGVWDNGKQCWFVPDERAEEARTLVGVGQARANSSRFFKPEPNNNRQHLTDHTLIS